MHGITHLNWFGHTCRVPKSKLTKKVIKTEVRVDSELQDSKIANIRQINEKSMMKTLVNDRKMKK